MRHIGKGDFVRGEGLGRLHLIKVLCRAIAMMARHGRAMMVHRPTNVRLWHVVGCLGLAARGRVVVIGTTADRQSSACRFIDSVSLGYGRHIIRRPGSATASRAAVFFFRVLVCVLTGVSRSTTVPVIITRHPGVRAGHRRHARGRPRVLSARLGSMHSGR